MAAAGALARLLVGCGVRFCGVRFSRLRGLLTIAASTASTLSSSSWRASFSARPVALTSRGLERPVPDQGLLNHRQQLARLEP
jgi:hypothetical protein